MQKYHLLIVLFFITVCPILVAQNWFTKKMTPAIDNPKEIQATLQGLVPTEAEAKAISQLRDKVACGKDENVSIPETDIPDASIAIELRFITVNSPLAKMIITEPAMTWSSLLNQNDVSTEGQQNVPLAESTPGKVWSGTYTEMPILVRFLEESSFAKFYAVLQSQRQATIMECPQVMVRSGQKVMVNDTTKIPFVQSVLPVIADYETAYQPILQSYNYGQVLMVQGTLLQDGSCRLDKCHFEMNSPVKVETTQLLVEMDGKKQRSSITVQVPECRSFRVSIPEIVIPKNMSLLVAFPGVEESEVFLLITTRGIYDSEDEEKGEFSSCSSYNHGYGYKSEDMRRIQDEWEKFWMLDKR